MEKMHAKLKKNLVAINLKSDNLQYNTLVRWFSGTNDSSIKHLMFQALYFFMISYKSLCQNYKNIMHGTSDALSMSHLSHQTSEPAYYIVDCRI